MGFWLSAPKRASARALTFGRKRYMNQLPHRRFSTAVKATAIFASSVVVFAVWPPQSTTLNFPFEQAIDYMNYAFRTNMTSSSAVWARGPAFLSTHTVYTISDIKYHPGDRLEFMAWFAQIGGEYNSFVVRKRASDKTRISIDQRTTPFIPYASWIGERHALWKLKRDAAKWYEKKSAGQGVAGQPPQGVGSPTRDVGLKSRK